MDITIVRNVKKQVPVLDENDKQVKEGGKPLFREVDDVLEDVFEVHPHETIGSVASRFAKKNKLGDPPHGEPSLALERATSLAFNPSFTMKAATTKIMDLDGTKRFVLKVWKGG